MQNTKYLFLAYALFIAILSTEMPWNAAHAEQAPSPADEETRWASQFGFPGPGVNGTVFASAMDQKGNLYVGGHFTRAGNAAAVNFAKWDGTNWSGLGYDGGTVYSLAIDSKGNIYVGADDSTRPWPEANPISKWDGVRWSSLGAKGKITYALAIDSADNLYASMYEHAYNLNPYTRTWCLGKWDGSHWSTLVDRVFMHTLIIDKKGNLYAGGDLSSIFDGSERINLARWDGAAWFPVDSGFGLPNHYRGYIRNLAEDNDGNILVGGYFHTDSNDKETYFLSRWNGTSWVSMFTGDDTPYSTSISALSIDRSGNLYFGINSSTDKQGYYAAKHLSIGDVMASRILRWDGSDLWTLHPGYKSGAVYSLMSDAAGNLYAGGSITEGICRWEGTSRRSLGRANANFYGTNGSVYALTRDRNNHLYAGGDFTRAGDVTAGGIAHWNGTNWSPLGSGVDGIIYALATDFRGEVYAGGLFSQSGGHPTNNIAKWNGTGWSDLGEGINGIVYALAADRSGNLYVGGHFTRAGGYPANSVAKWDGKHWSTLGADMRDGYIRALVVDSAGNLYAGGTFQKTGEDPANYIARWNGQEWSNLKFPGDSSADVRALAIDERGNLWAARSWTCGFLSYWNGAEWTSSYPWNYSYDGSYSCGIVNALAFDGSGNLYMGGYFGSDYLGSDPTWEEQGHGGIIKYNRRIDGGPESGFPALGSGIQRPVYALSMGAEDLFIGGGFPESGGKSSSNLARWVTGNTRLAMDACAGIRSDTVFLNTTLESTASVSDLQFDLVFDPAVLTFREAYAGPQAGAAGKSIAAVKVSSERMRVTIGSNNDKALMSNGIVARFEFTVAADAPLTNASVRIEKAAGFPPQGAGYGYPPVGDAQYDIPIVNPPAVAYLQPSSGPAGSLLVLKTADYEFCSTASIRVVFSGTTGYRTSVVPLEILKNRITVTVPSDARGTLRVSLQDAESPEANSLTFTVTADRPFPEFPAEVQAFTPLGSDAASSGVAVDPGSDLGFLADGANHRILAVDLIAGSKRSEYTLSGGAPTRLAFHSATRQLVTTLPDVDGLGVLYVSPDGTMRNPSLIPVGDSPFGVDILPSANRAVVANRGSGDVSIVDLDRKIVLTTVKTGRQPTEVTVDQVRHRAFVIHTAGYSLWEIDLTTFQAANRIANLGSRPYDLDFHEESGTLLVGLENGLLLFRPDSGQTTMLLAGESVHSLTIDPVRGWAVVANNTTGRMTTIDLNVVFSDAARAVIGAVPTSGLQIQDMALHSQTNRGLVTARKSGSGISTEEAGSAGFAVWTMPSSMNFPRLLPNPTEDVLALAVANPGRDVSVLQLTATEAAGQRVSGLGSRNPATVSLPAGTQMARYESDETLFGSALHSTGEHWHKLVSPNPDLKAFFLTADPEFRDSLVGAEETGHRLLEAVLPAIRPGASHLIGLVNPAAATAAVTLRLIDDSGAILQTVTGTIPPHGSMHKRIEELFPAGPPPGGSGGYVRVSASTGVRAYQLLIPEGKTDAAGFNAQSALTGSSQLDFAYFAAGTEAGTGAVYETRAGMVNLTAGVQTVALTIRNEKGLSLAPSRTIEIPAHGRIEVDLLSLFQLSPAQLTQGWLQVQGTGLLAGYLTYGTEKALAAVVSMTEPRTQLTFSHVAEVGTGFFTGLALLNTDKESTSVVVSVYRADGLLVAASDPLAIAPNGQRVALLHQLVGPAIKGQSGGYVVVRSTRPIRGIEIFGTDSLSALANVPAQ